MYSYWSQIPHNNINDFPYSEGCVFVVSELQFKNASSVPDPTAAENVLMDEATNNSNFSLPIIPSTIVIASKHCQIVLLTLHNTVLNQQYNSLILISDT